MLLAVISHWRAGSPIALDHLEYEMVHAGHLYSDVMRSREAMAKRQRPTLTSLNKTLVPTLAGLIELGHEGCVSDLESLAAIVGVLHNAYRPDHKGLTIDAVAEHAALPSPLVKRIGSLTGVLGKDDRFNLDARVLGWRTFEDFLNAQLPPRGAIDRAVEAAPSRDLQIGFTPSSISWTNLGPFAAATLELGPLTVLVGANSAGKTAALQVLELLRAIARQGLDALQPDEIGTRSPASHRGLVGAGNTDFDLQVVGELTKHGLVWSDAAWTLTVALHPLVNARHEELRHLEAQTEAFANLGVGEWLDVNAGMVPLLMRPDDLALRLAHDPARHPALMAIRQSLARWQALTERPPLAIRTHLGADPTNRILGPPFLAATAELEQAAKAVLGPLHLHHEHGRLLFEDRRGHRTQIDDTPSGTYRVLAILAYLVDPMPPTLLAIDELENHLHVDVAARLLDVMRSHTRRTRLVVSTHSANILRCVTPSEVRVVRTGESGSTIGSLVGDPHLATLAAAGDLAALLRDGHLGGGA